jgi:hypothetical protein
MRLAQRPGGNWWRDSSDRLTHDLAQRLRAGRAGPEKSCADVKHGASSLNRLAPDDLHVINEFFALQGHAQRRHRSHVETGMRLDEAS